MRTAEQIAARAEKYQGMANKASINRQYRKQDDSHLFPICNQFNLTERVIRQVRAWQHASGVELLGLEYCLTLEAAMSAIVNN
tara:strand:+ start:234 stop:482 length:249 start_codon:yes stop_codon:yes gene_type:complete